MLALVLGGTTRAPAGELPEPAELETFFDAELEGMLEEGAFPGAALVVVQGDRVILSKGYGVADIETGRRIDPQQTLFRVGSISKLVTALMVLQQVERGKMDLDADVNLYLRSLAFDSPPGQPTTLRHLLTHTEGLDPAWAIAGATTNPDDLIPLGTFLRQRMPPRILPPGKAYVYHDAGLAVAGLAVEDQAGRPFHEVARRNVFEPLNMTRATFAQPLPPELMQDLARGYRGLGDQFKPTPFEYVYSVPTVGLTAAPADLGKLMVALLNDGSTADGRLLQPQTIAEAMRVHFRHHPSIPGAGLANYERYRNGHRTLQHGGLTLGYTNLMILMPEQKIGILLSGNALGLDVFEPTVQAFFDAYFPQDEAVETAAAPAVSGNQPVVEGVEGRYRYIAHSHSTVAKVTVLGGMTDEFDISTREDGALIMGSRNGGSVWEPVSPGLYKHGDLRLALMDEQDGQVDLLAVDLYPFKRIAWWEDLRLHWSGLAGMTGLFVLTCISAGIRTWRGRRCPADPLPRLRRLASRLCLGGACVNVLFIALFFLTVGAGDLWGFFHGMPTSTALMLVLPLISAAITLEALAISGASFFHDRWPLWAAARHAVVLGGMVLFGLFCAYWNLLGVTPKI